MYAVVYISVLSREYPRQCRPQHTVTSSRHSAAMAALVARGESHVGERLDPELRVEQVEAGVRVARDPKSDVGNQRHGVGVPLSP